VSPEARGFLGFLLGLAAIGVAGSVLVPRLLGAAAGVENDLVVRLKQAEREGFAIEVPGRPEPIEAARVSFSRVSVDVDAARGRAEIVSTLDFEARAELAKPSLRVSSLGVERTVFHLREGAWVLAEEGWAPRLRALLTQLERRRQALEAKDAEAFKRLLLEAPAEGVDPLVAALAPVQALKYSVLAYFIRSEPEGAEVTERYRISGWTPDRPIDDTGERSLTLRRRGQEFLFLSQAR
jgi:hypothetical protein